MGIAKVLFCLKELHVFTICKSFLTYFVQLEKPLQKSFFLYKIYKEWIRFWSSLSKDKKLG